MEINEEDAFRLDNDMKATDYYRNLKRAREAQLASDGLNKIVTKEIETKSSNEN